MPQRTKICVFYFTDSPNCSGLLCNIPYCFYLLAPPVHLYERIVFGSVFEICEYLGGKGYLGLIQNVRKWVGFFYDLSSIVLKEKFYFHSELINCFFEFSKGMIFFISNDDIFEVVVDDDYVIVLFEFGDEVVKMVLFDNYYQ